MDFPLIKLEKITKTYQIGEQKIPVLHGVSLEIQKGEYVALMGASGSGKSTLMNILGCLDRPTTGNYLLEEKSIGYLNNHERALIRNRKIGFVFQSFNLLSRTSALDNVIMPLQYRNPRPSMKEQKLIGMAMLEQVGLADRSHHQPSQLSGGQQQRVAIARALISNPPILFADEPTGNLDSRTSREIMEMFTELNNTIGLTVILVTHSDEIANYAQRSIHIKDGFVVNGEY